MWKPESGYSFVDTSANLNFKVKWTPGLKHSSLPHITSNKKEGYWNSNSGYTFVDLKKDLDTIWTPGKRHPTATHVLAHEEEFWTTDPGYTFVKPIKALVVKWEPGRTHPKWAHVQSGSSENQWVPKSGYKFVDKKKDLLTRKQDNLTKAINWWKKL